MENVCYTASQYAQSLGTTKNSENDSVYNFNQTMSQHRQYMASWTSVLATLSLLVLQCFGIHITALSLVYVHQLLLWSLLSSSNFFLT